VTVAVLFVVVAGEEVADGKEVCGKRVFVVDCFEVCAGHDCDAGMMVM